MSEETDTPKATKKNMKTVAGTPTPKRVSVPIVVEQRVAVDQRRKTPLSLNEPKSNTPSSFVREGAGRVPVRRRRDLPSTSAASLLEPLLCEPSTSAAAKATIPPNIKTQ